MLGIPQNSFWVMVIILCLLTIASFLRIQIETKNPEKDYTELRQRIQSWWLMIGILFFVLIMSKNLAIIFFAFLSFLALKEFLSIVPTRQCDRRVILWAYLSIPVQYFWVYLGEYGMFIIFIPVYMLLILPMRMILIGETKGFIRSAGILHWASMLSIFSISHIAFLMALPTKNENAGYIGLVLFILFMTQFNDVCQYVWGKSFGKHKIIPKVSPNKTWEGFLGGFFTISLTSSIIGPLLTPLNMIEGAIAGALISVSGFANKRQRQSNSWSWRHTR